MYAAVGLGVYKTTDSGLNWQPSNAGMTTLETTSLAIDPLESSVVYAGTNGGGVFKSADAGATWTAMNAGFGNLRISVLTMDPTNPSTLYAGTRGSWTDAFLTKLGPGGASIGYSTYLGGSWNDEGRGVAVDDRGNAHVAGLTRSLDFPIADAIQPGPGGPLNVNLKDAFITKVDASGSALLYSTYLGGTRDDEAFGVAVDRAGNAYVTGQTGSDGLPDDGGGVPAGARRRLCRNHGCFRAEDHPLSPQGRSEPPWHPRSPEPGARAPTSSEAPGRSPWARSPTIVRSNSATLSCARAPSLGPWQFIPVLLSFLAVA